MIEVLGDEGDKFVEGNVAFPGDITIDEHLFNFLFGGFMSKSLHGLLPLLLRTDILPWRWFHCHQYRIKRRVDRVP